MVKCLGEVKWLVIGSPYPVMIYSDHAALKNILLKVTVRKARINGWHNRLGEFDLKLVYRPSTDQHIGIADGLSRMPTKMLTESKIPVRRKNVNGLDESGVATGENFRRCRVCVTASEI